MDKVYYLEIEYILKKLDELIKEGGKDCDFKKKLENNEYINEFIRLEKEGYIKNATILKANIGTNKTLMGDIRLDRTEININEVEITPKGELFLQNSRNLGKKLEYFFHDYKRIITLIGLIASIVAIVSIFK